MAKIDRGRLDGFHGMSSFTSAELFAWADKMESQIKNPDNQDDPEWLQRWANNIKRLTTKKEKSKLHKANQR